MKIRLFAGALMLVAVTVAATTAMVSPQDEKSGNDPMQDEQMKAWMEANKLTDLHRQMASSAGEWTAENTQFNDDGTVKGKSIDSCSTEVVLGGRYVKEHYHGKFGPTKFEGVGMLGFDTINKEWVHVWFDNFSTGPSVTRGKPGDDPKVVTLRGAMKDPSTGNEMGMEMVSTIVSNDEHHLDMYAVTPEGRVRNMHIKYTRKK